MLNHAESQNFDSDAVGDAMRARALQQHLEEKYQDRAYHEENGWWYEAVQYASYVFQFINIASGFAKPFAYLSGIFAFGLFGGIVAAAVSAFFVVGVEWAARKNLTQVFEKKYFKNRVYSGRVVMQLFLNGAIIALSYWGASDAVKIMSGDFTPSEVAFESEAQVREHYMLLVTSAQKDADAFFAASNWKGKLSPANQRRYNDKLADKAKFQAKMDEELSAIRQRNLTKEANAKANDQLALMEKKESDAHNGNILGIVAVISCLLFTLCIWLKELYEYRTAMELVSSGAIKNKHFAQRLAEAQSTITDEKIRKEFATLNGSEFKNTGRPIGFKWPNYGKSAYPTDELSRQPLFPKDTENTVPQPQHTVAQQIEVAAMVGADQILELLRQTIQKDIPNFANKQANPSTVSARICKELDAVYVQMAQPGFTPSRSKALQLYQYLQGTVFPTLAGRGFPYLRDQFFAERLYSLMPALETA